MNADNEVTLHPYLEFHFWVKFQFGVKQLNYQYPHELKQSETQFGNKFDYQVIGQNEISNHSEFSM